MSRIDILNAFEQEPQPLDFVLPSFLAGTVGALIAPGATGKSYFALQACMSIACAVAGGDLLGLKSKSGLVVYINAEDPEVIVRNRIFAIGKKLNQQAKESIAKNLFIEPMLGKRLDIVDDAQRKRIIGYCIGARLIVFDTLSRIHTLDENSNSHASQIIGMLEQIATETGASVLFLHHVSKASTIGGMAELQQAARGASALIDNARWCGYVAKMTKDEAKNYSENHFNKQAIDPDFCKNFIKFGVSKQNYGQPFLEKWLKFCDGGTLMSAEILRLIKR
ncbi:Replication protein A [methanotrophic endosymbiont of Bathymodiolus azoricus (Menez Gwen)]|nr:Replication protein A [methanotrophic endosymbiont of Bathymodiolus azoricus (Menez Gwen)]